MTRTTPAHPARRAFFRQIGGGAAATAALTLGAGPASATAAVDPAQLNGAGFYRFSLGTKTITVLADGNSTFPGQGLFAVNADQARFAEVQDQLLQPAESVDFHMNTLLVEEGDRKILIDAGFGHFLGPKFGRQTVALQNAGIDPADIDTVIISHGHADHFAGLVSADLNLRFPNAQIVWNEAEWGYWTSDQAVSDVRNSPLPDAFKDLFIATTQTVLPIAAQNLELVTVRQDVEIAPGIVLMPAPGHSPHSMVILIASGDEQLLYASDTTLLVKQNAIAPDWVSAFEYDAKGLVETRVKLLDRAASDGISWFGYHASFPAVGRIRKTSAAYEFVETPWQW